MSTLPFRDFLQLGAVCIAHGEQSFEEVAAVEVDQWRGRSWSDEKPAREAAFPLELLEKGHEIRVEQGQASWEEDRRRILNSIAGKPLESEPEVQHPAYTDVHRIDFE